MTLIFLWDEVKDYVLVSKYNPLNIGIGDTDMARNDDVSALSNTNTSPLSKVGKKLTTEEQTLNMVETAVTLVMDKDSAQKKENDNSDEIPLELQPLGELMKLYDMYMSNFKFHKKNGTMTQSHKEKMMMKIDELFAIIEDRSISKKRARDDSSGTNNNKVS